MSTSEYVNKRYSNMTWKLKPSSRCEYCIGKMIYCWLATTLTDILSQKRVVLQLSSSCAPSIQLSIELSLFEKYCKFGRVNYNLFSVYCPSSSCTSFIAHVITHRCDQQGYLSKSFTDWNSSSLPTALAWKPTIINWFLICCYRTSHGAQVLKVSWPS